jgi:flagellar M-ring protein FliF
MIVGVGILAAALIFGLSRWAGQPEWVPAFTNVPMETVAKMTDQLDQAGVSYRLEKGGSEVHVASSDLARARVVLAREGLPAAGRPGLELFDQPSWGMTDFTQRINYRRALEGELERTIGKMRGIEAAQVHLALHEASSFRRPDEKPPEASVVLKLRSGQDPDRDVVQGIAHLVASSVDGIEAQYVTVLDDAGRLLSDEFDPSSPGGLTNQQLKVQKEVESYLEQKAQRIVGDIVGGGNARVQVSAAINFDKVERTVEAVDPDKQALATEQRSEITPGADGGAASSNTATSYENSRSTETFSGAIGNLKRLSVAVLVNDKLVPAAKPGAKPSVVARTPEELARIETLVRTAVGVDSARGDMVSVVSVAFDTPAPVDEPVDKTAKLIETVKEVQRPALTALGLLLAFAVALVALRSLRPASTPAPAVAPALAPGSGALPAIAAGATADAPPALDTPASSGVPAISASSSTPTIVLPSSPTRDRVAATVEQHPEVAARLVRSWLKES